MQNETADGGRGRGSTRTTTSSSNEEPPPPLRDITTMGQPTTHHDHTPHKQHTTRLHPHELLLVVWMVGGMTMMTKSDGGDTTTAVSPTLRGGQVMRDDGANSHVTAYGDGQPQGGDNTEGR
jgi:hypothetical protein